MFFLTEKVLEKCLDFNTFLMHTVYKRESSSGASKVDAAGLKLHAEKKTAKSHTTSILNKHTPQVEISDEEDKHASLYDTYRHLNTIMYIALFHFLQ